MAEDKPNCFFLVAVDRSTGCVSHEVSFEIKSVSELCAVLHWDAEAFCRPMILELDHSSVERLKEHFSIDFDPMDMFIELRPWNRTGALPYKVHTNRELAMMIAGTKPLAVFCDVHPSEPDERFIPEEAFEPHVLAGRIVKREQILPAPPNSSPQHPGHHLGERLVLYALPNETWRIEAYLLMRETAAKSGWSEGFERMEAVCSVMRTGRTTFSSNINEERFSVPALLRAPQARRHVCSALGIKFQTSSKRREESSSDSIPEKPCLTGDMSRRSETESLAHVHSRNRQVTPEYATSRPDFGYQATSRSNRHLF